jgi:hypothetical protein
MTASRVLTVATATTVVTAEIVAIAEAGTVVKAEAEAETAVPTTARKLAHPRPPPDPIRPQST